MQRLNPNFATWVKRGTPNQKDEHMKWIPICLTLTLTLGLAACNKTEPRADETVTPVADVAMPTVSVPMADQPAAVVDSVTDAISIPSADLSKIVAKVGQHEISEAQIQDVMEVFLKRSAGRIPPEQLAEALPGIRERIIEELIMRQIMVDAVAQAGISLSESEFEGIKAELASELPPDVSIEAYMAEIGMTTDQLREQMLVRKMVVAKAEAIEKPTDEEIRAFYDENQEGFAQEETVSASHILIKIDEATDDDAAKTAKRERLEGLRQELIAGADFAELAEANSDCPSGKNGGDLGPFGRGQMVPEFEDAAFSQPVGSVGEVVTTPFGYHLIKVSEKTDAKTLAFEDVKERISDIIYSQKQQDAVTEYVEGLRTAAVIERFDAPTAADPVFELEDAAPAAEAVEEATLVEEDTVVVVEEIIAEDAPEVEAEIAEATDAVLDASEEAVDAVVEATEDTSLLDAAAAEIEIVAEKAEEVLEEAAAVVAPVVEKVVEETKDIAEKAAAGIQEGAEKVVDALTPAPVDEIVPAPEGELETP